MRAARALRYARRRAGLSQRALASKAGLPQSTVGRIEAGSVDPQFRTLSRLLQACGFDLEVEPLLGIGVDRTLIRACLARSPAERLAANSQGAQLIHKFRTGKKLGAWSK